MIHALHGNFGLPSDWDAALPPGVPAKAWHLWEIRRNHPEARTLTGFATWFNNQIEALPPDPNRILAGYSLGGRLALHVLLDRPHLWNQTLILSAHPGLASDTERKQRLEHDLIWKHRCLTQPLEATLHQWNEQPVLQHSPEGNADRSALNLWQEEIAAAFEGWSLGQQLNLLPDHATVPCSGLWLAGAEDLKFAGLAQQSMLSLPGFRLHLIAGGGHRLLQSHSAAVRSAFQDLLV